MRAGAARAPVIGRRRGRSWGTPGWGAAGVGRAGQLWPPSVVGGVAATARRGAGVFGVSWFVVGACCEANPTGNADASNLMGTNVCSHQARARSSARGRLAPVRFAGRLRGADAGAAEVPPRKPFGFDEPRQGDVED